MHLFLFAIEPDHLAEAIAEAVPMRLGEIVHLVCARIDAARRYAVQQWLPDMGPAAFHQSDGCPPAPAKAIAEAGDQFQPPCSSPHHHDSVQRADTGAPASAVRYCRWGLISVDQGMICIAVQDVRHVRSIRVNWAV